MNFHKAFQLTIFALMVLVVTGCPGHSGGDDPVPEYTVVFNSAGGTAISSVKAESGSLLIKPVDPAKDGYEFGGWYKEQTCSTAWDFAADTVVADIILWAKWTAVVVEYEVLFDSQEGSAVDGVKVASGMKLVQPSSPTRTGYSFGGWYKEKECVSAWNFDADVVTGSTTLYAKWVVNGYAVSFDSQGGTAIEPVSAHHGDKIGSPSSPSKNGYAFGGWYKEASCSNRWDFAADTVTAATILYAKWDSVGYTVSYTLNGGTNSPANPENFTVESSSITLAPATRANYTFAGWHTKADFSDTAVSTIAKGSTGNKVF
jgi:uncharacterized repeat protein (TIGR02543 family)